MEKLDSKRIENILSLTPMQEGMLFHYLQAPRSGLYFEQLSLEIFGKIDGQVFEKAWNTVVETNEMLRSVFRWEKVEKPSQIILKEHPCKVIIYDLSDKDGGQRKPALEEIKNRDRHDAFDLHQVPFRVILCKLDEKKYEMVVSNHHILYDGWSNGIILGEFFNVYRALSKGEVFTPPVKPKFKEFVKWIQRQDTAKQEKFWGNYLKELGANPDAPAARKRKKTREAWNTANDRFQFPDELKNKLDHFIKSLNITTASLLYSAWGVLLQKYHAAGDIIFDATVSGRSAGASAAIKGIENMVGLFINTLPLRIQTQSGETVSSFLSRTYHMLRQWSEFENSSPLPVREILAKQRRENLFDSVVVFENYPLDSLTPRDTAPLSLHSFYIVEKTLYDLTVIITTLDSIELNITYNNDVFDKTGISHLFKQLVSIVEEMVTHPEKEVSEIDVWAEGDRGKFLEHIRAVREGEPGVGTGYMAPRDEVEEKLVEIWSEVLNIDRGVIGIDHNFFEFGGHSLKAAMLVSVLRKEFEVKISLAEIFDRSTIRELGEYIRGAGRVSYVPVGAVEEKEYYAVSAAQGRMVALWQMEPGSIAYNVSGAFLAESDGGTEWVEAFETALNRLVERHESLRTSFIFVNGEPVQKIHKFLLSKVFSGVKGAVFSKKAPLFIQPFDLSKAPLMRVGLIRVDESKHLLVFDAHHIIFDGVSMNVFINELTALYNGKDLPPVRIQYRDFSEWQRKQLSSGANKGQENYWLSTFGGEAPVLNLPTDYPRTHERAASSEGDTLFFNITRETREKLRTLEKHCGATLYMVLLAAYYTVLMKYSGQEDIVVGTLTDGRPHGDLRGIIGVMITTLAMRNYPRGEIPFMEFLREVKSNCLKAFENADYPFEELLKYVRVKGESGGNRLFNTMFLLQNFEWPEFFLEGVVFKPYRFKTNASTFEWRITAVEREGEIEIEIQYAARLFKEDTIERFVGHFINVLNEAAENPHRRLGDMQLLSEEEAHRILFEFNATEVDTGVEKTVIHRFEEQVEKTPDRIAVFSHGRTRTNTDDNISIAITYCHLNEQSDGVAGLLIEKGVLADSIVGIMVDRSIEMVIGIYGILKAGGAYLPIDPEYPQERIDYMLADSNAKVLIINKSEIRNSKFETNSNETNSNDPNQNRNFGISFVLNFEHLNFDIVSCFEFRASDFNSSNLAYIIYTSGTTGKPKGAGVYHRGFFNLIYWFVTEFGINAEDRNLLLTSLSFDLTQKNIFAPLVTGGNLTLPAVDYFDPADILQTVEKRQVTWLNCTPGMIYKLIEYSRNEDLKKLFSLRYAFLGGEPLALKGMQKWIKSQYFNVQIVNTYGPTECTDICACFSVKEPRQFNEENIPTGKPIYNVQLYVLDRWFEVSPAGVTGELFIGGTGVGPGYINNPELSSEKFINFHHSSFIIHHSKLYRTGDLVRWMADGNIEFLGRIDHQVKIRGYRIELGEIESRLLTFAQIKEATVLAMNRTDGAGHYLCAYFTAGKNLELKELKSHLSAQLPGYMIPSYFMQIEKFPLTPHGKIDRRLLPIPVPDNEGTRGTSGEDIPNELLNETEKKLVKIWQEILGIEKVGVADNFFELGGDSLSVIQAIARIREIFGVDLPVRKYFEHSNIKDLAKEIEMLEKDIVHIPRAPEGVLIPLSFSQEQLWFLQQLNDRNVSYFVPRVIRICGQLDTELIEHTFDEIIRRHEILRTVFPTIDGQPIQQVLDHSPFKLPFIDLSGLEESGRKQEVEKWMAEEGRRLFDFEKGPMIRITLLKLKAEEHLLVLTEHHLVHDGWTQGVLLKEFIAIFNGFWEGKGSPLPELPIQYKDYAWWQRNYLQGEVLEKQLAYWQEKLSGLAPLLELPTDRPRPPEISGNGEVKRLFLAKELSDDLITFSRQRGVTLFMTMLGVYKVLLYRYTGTGDLCVGTGVANRRYKEMEGMLGMVINTLALRTEIDGEFTFEECLQRVKTTCLEAYENEDTPFEKIVALLQPERSLSYTPIFQSMYSFMDTPADTLKLPGLELHVEEVHNRSAKFDIGIIVEPPSEERMEETGGRIEIIWEYNVDIFDGETMNRMINHYIRLLEEAVQQPDVSLSNLPMLSSEEIQRLLVEWNDTGAEYPGDKIIHELFAEQVERTPDHIAVFGHGRTLSWTNTDNNMPMAITYRELNAQSNRLARLLREKGAGPDAIVGLLIERSVDMLVGIFGILKVGGAYLPVDPGYPLDRIVFMLKDSGAKLLAVANDQEGEKVRSWEGEKVLLEEIPKSSYPLTFLSSYLLNPSNLAYVIYTSGSTGKPKGVVIEHHSLVNRLNWMQKTYPLDKRDTILQKTTFTFDVSVWEIFWWSIVGAKVCLLLHGGEKDPEIITEAVAKNNVTTMHFVPSMLSVFLDYLKESRQTKKLSCLKQVIASGEALLSSHVVRFDELLNKETGVKLANLYGPTEATIDVSYFDCMDGKEREIIPIGKPIDNINLYILDRSFQYQPVGVVGELHIAGVGLARGYLNRPELTAERFISFHHSSFIIHHSILYSTGDLARWQPDGNIEFLGRIDNQIKIRGFRIELGEIESRLLEHPSIKEAVAAQEGERGDKYLCAYVVTDGENVVSELRDYLSKELPDYMIPSYFVPLEKIPLTPNGKIDRKALPKPGLKAGEKYTAPRNEIEKKLVGLWSEILGRGELHASQLQTSIGIDDNFFQLGGHSLKATILAGRIEKTFNIKIPLSEIFKSPRIRELAGYIKEAASRKYEQIEFVEKKEYYVLSSAQKRLYFLQQMDKSSTAYNIPSIMIMEGIVEKDRLEQSIRGLIRRHESFRTSFVIINEEPVQRIHEFPATDEHERTQTLSEVFGPTFFQKGGTSEAIIKSFIRPFDLSKAPLLRVGLVRLAEDKHIFLVDMHHIISDGTSINVLVQDFSALYAGDELREIILQYKDYAEWQNRERVSKKIQEQGEYWKKEYEGEIPVLALPVDYPRPAVQSFEGNRIPFEIDKESTVVLKALTLKTGATLYMLLLALYAVFLSKVTGQEEIVIGSPIAGRRHTDLAEIIGMFVNTLALRNYPSGEKRFVDFLEEVKEKTLKAFENQDYQYEDLVEQVAVNRATNRNPLFDSMLVLQNMGVGEINIPGLKLTPYDLENKTSKFDLTLTGVEIEGKLEFAFEYCTKLFKPATIERFITFFKNIVSGVLEDKCKRLSSLEIIPVEEKHALLYEFNDTEVDYPKYKRIHHLLTEQVEKTPDKIALVTSFQNYMTYWDLNERAGHLGWVLKNKGVGPNCIVGLMMERSIEMIQGLLGILKAGGAYLPVDPDYPPERVQFMLEDSESSLLVTRSKFTGSLDFRRDIISIENIGSPIDTRDSEIVDDRQDLVYMIYTSGSTGKPKGVKVQKEGFLNLLRWYIEELDIGEEDNNLLIAPISFDLSQKNLFSPFLTGGCLTLSSPGIHDYRELTEIIHKERISMINCAPSVFYPLIDFNDDTCFTQLQSLRAIILGGEPIRSDKLLPWVNSGAFHCEIINTYGPTECTDIATFYRIPGETFHLPKVIPIGRPIPNVKVYVLDKYLQVLPVRISGELCIGGIGLSRGYYNNVPLTQAKFVDTPYLPEKKVYCTGDLAWWLPDGNIEFLGRIDNQVKVRGFRIELGEIESELSKHEEIKEVVVTSRQSETGDNYLCAYIVPRMEQKVFIPGLREYLGCQLPDYMVPSYFVYLDRIPQTPSGKIDRLGLPEPKIKERKNYTAPRDQIEEELVKIWRGVLDNKTLPANIGIDDNFFQLGGHSLKAAALVSRIHKIFNVKIPLTELFKRPTIRGLSAYIGGNTVAEQYIEIAPVEKKEYYVLSSAQKRMYFLQQMDKEGTGYNIPSSLILEGAVDKDKMEQSIRELIRRHESLRTSIVVIEEEAVQRIHEHVEFEIEQLGIRDQGLGVSRDDPAWSPDKRGEKQIIMNFIRAFDLSKAPLMRVGLIKVEADKHVLVVDMHHIISDGVSTEILIREFTALYAGKVLPEIKLQYKDYAEWQNLEKVSNKILEKGAYWEKEYEGEIPVLELPTDYARPTVQGFEGSSINFEINSKTYSVLKALALETEATLYIVLLALYTILLSKLSNQEDIVIGSPVAGRRHADLEKIIGMFVNTLALRNYPSGEKKFTDFLEEIKGKTLKAFENQEYQYEDLVEKVAVTRDVSRNPLFDTMFALQNTDSQKIDIPGLKLVPYEYENKTSKFDLTLTAVEIEEKLLFTFEYSTKLFKSETIERFIAYFKNLIRSIVENKNWKIFDLEILTEDEKNRILFEFNDTEAEYPKEKTVHQLFEEQALKSPDRIAIVGDGGGEEKKRRREEEKKCGVETLRATSLQIQITYSHLNQQSDHLAGLLIEKGVLADTIVGIMVERSVEMIVGILGILKSGGAYLPMDPDYPQERIDYMLKDSAAKLLVTTNDQEGEKVRRWEGEKVLLESIIYPLNHFPYHHSSFIIHHSHHSHHLAYLIYTSGSTGKPKGVMVQHESLVNASYGWRDEYRLDKINVNLLQMAGYSFDVSCGDLCRALLNGGTLFICPTDVKINFPLLYDYLCLHRITLWESTPALVVPFMDYIYENRLKPGYLQLLIIGSDNFRYTDYQRLLCRYGKSMRIINSYGVTEATIDSTYYEPVELDAISEFVPIGRPMPNVKCFIFDAYSRVQSMGIPGELVIASSGIARGYANRPELTAEKFKRVVISQLSLDISSSKKLINVYNDQCPMTNDYPKNLTNDRLYKTGDLSRWLPDGNIEFLGRIDQQVKIRGFRIELGEIENELSRHNDIKEAVVVAQKSETGSNYLCAYIVCRDKIELSGLREYLGKHLPNYMLPSYFVNLEKIPLTVNGKIDRNALPDPGGSSLRDDMECMPPRNAVEKKLVEMWEKILGRTNIGINENFFQVGGDSIKSIQIISRMGSAGYKLEMRDLFQYPVISELAPHVKKLKRIPDQSVITGTIPLTPIQGMFFQQSHIAPHHYNHAVMLFSREGFANDAIKGVFSRIQEHHDALRTTYERDEDSGKIIQVTHGLDYPFYLEEHDLKDCENCFRELEIKANRIQAGIDLEKGPLMKLGLFHLNDGDRLLIVIHHLVIDGVSWRILFEDIDTLYGQYKRGEKLVLPPKTDSFKLWSEKLSAYANSKTFLKEKTFWQKIESIEVPIIQKDFEVDDNYSKDTGSITFALNEAETEGLLTKANRAFGTENNDILLTALGMGIKNTFGQERVSIALEGHGREEILEDIDISRTVGWFTSLYPVVLDFSYSEHPGRQIKEIKEILRRIPNKGIGYGILKYLTPEENRKESEFKLEPQISFNYLGQFDADVQQKSSFEPAKESAGNSMDLNNKREYLLDVSGMTVTNRLTMSISYNKTHFKPGTIAALAGNFEAELRQLIAFCCAKENIVHTPSDFTYKGLSIDRIDRLMEEYPTVEDIYTLAPMQEGMLYHALADNSSYSYFEQMSYRLLGELDICLVEKSLNELFKRHDILRTAFVYEDIERPVQVVLKDRTIDFYYEDISKIGEWEVKENFVGDFKEKDKQQSFNLSKSVLMRISILRMEESRYEFIWSSHHILMDGWCTGILNTEFLEIYAGYLENRPYRLGEVKPYRTYIQWLEKQEKEESARYWANYLDSFEEMTTIPRTYLSGEGDRYRNETVSIELDIEKTAALNRLAAGNHATLNTVAQTLWGILLGKYNGKEDVVFGAVVSGRPSELEGVESIVGLFINTIPVRIRFEEKMKFYRLLQQVQQEALAGEPYHYHPLAEIQSGSALKQNLIDHILIFENYPIAEQIEGYGSERNKSNKPALKLTNVEAFEQTNYDFNVILGGADRLRITFKYNGNVYEGNFVKMVAKHFSIAVDQVIGNQELEAGDLMLLSEEEKNRLLYEFNDTEADYPNNMTIYRLFEEQVERTPNYIALIGQSVKMKHWQSLTDANVSSAPIIQLSYRELNEMSNRLAYQLREKGVGSDSAVGLMVERSLEMIIGMLAIMKAGGAYLPIDSELPGERKRYMLEDGEIRWLLVSGDIKDVGDEIINRLEVIDLRQEEIYRGRYSDLEYIGRCTDLVYVIYTSGSTGKPKGVMLEHRNLVNLIHYQYKNTNIDFNRVLQFTTISFDVSAQEIFSAFLSGGQLYLLNKETRTDIPELFGLIERNGIKTVFLPVSFLKAIFREEEYINLIPRCIGHITTAGEQVVISNNFRKYLRERKVYLHNHYGPSETHVVTTLTIDPGGEITELPSIGKPVMNTGIYIVDKWRRLSPLGTAGEIWIGGVQVGRGYLNRPELTAEKFINIHHSSFDLPRIHHSILYRTGDLGCWLPDGNIEFLGRIDHQVKIRGFRVEPGEIEIRLLNYPAIKEALVLVQEEERGDKYICAYIVSNDENVRPGLREYLSKELPDYMIPSYFVLLEKMPLTPNGKIDRKALPKTELKAGKSYVAPRDEVEEKLVGLWSDILGGDALHSSQSQTSIGIDDNFFELGGHSLKATILASRIEKIFNVKTPLSEIFKSPRIRELAGYIKDAAQWKYQQVELAEEKEYYALSSAQKRLHFLQQMDKDGTAYNIPSVMIMEGVVDKERLEQSNATIIQRHESFRTSFVIIGNEPVQRIHDEVAFEIEQLGIRDQGSGVKEKRRGAPPWSPNIIKNFIQPFDLSRAPLLRVGLIKIEEEKHIFMVDMHHIISDGTSINVLVQDFSTLYAGKELLKIKLQYKDYAEWQNRERVSKNIRTQGEFWKKEFEGEIPVLEMPTDYARPAVQGFEGNSINFEINNETSDALKALAMEMGATLYMVLLSLYTALLARLTGQEDTVIGSPVAGRRHADLERIIGMFVNTLALRNYPASEKKYVDFLAEVKEKTLKAFENQEYQYEDLVEKVTVTRDVNRNPLFDTMFALQNTGSQQIEIPGLKLAPYEYENKSSKFDLSLTGVEIEEKLVFTFEYSTKLFREETINRFIIYFKNIVRGVIENKERRISDFEIITAEEKRRILFEFNDTEAEYPKDKTIHRLFEEQVERIPDRIAVFGHGQTRTIIENHMHMAVTYFELNEKSDRLAYRLQEKGVEHDTIVGIIVERSIATIIGILGILKAGGAYMPIDSEYPQARIDFMVKDSGAKLLVTANDKEGEKVRRWEGETCYIEALPRSSYPLTFLPSYLQSTSNLAYIIYTSGSTGRPKGVMVEHRSVVNLVHWFGRAYRLQTGVNLLQLTGYNFDPSVEDIFSTLVHGASLYVASRDLLADIKKLREFIRTHRIHIIDFIPALLKELLCVGERLDSLQVVISGGERLEDSLKDRFLALGYRLYNHYGPTEITVDALVSECSQDKVTLGVPIANTQCFILDRDNNPAAPGVPGELCIAGVGLARGYLNCPELTAEKFGPQITLITQINEIKKRNIDKSFVRARGAPRRGEPIRNNSRILTPDPRPLTPKFYKTGDQCCWLPDGNLRFCGRIDDQIKIRGYRIELQEIENVFKNHKEIKDAVVLTRENKEGKVEIYAYYVDRSRINPVVWPSLGEYPLYDDFLYYAMTNDNLRNYSYKAAISRKVADKVVVEIGTGKDVILARFCVEVGARIVYAIEISEESFKKAQHTVKKLGFQDKIVLIHGDASSVEIPEKADICLSELIGTIGGSEGVAAILKIARRFLKENGEMIPDKCITKIAAVQLPLSIHQSPSFSRVSSPYVETLYRYSGHPFDFRICIDNFPSSSVISSDGIFEYLDFSGQIETEGKQYVELVINKDGRMDGLLLWLNLYTCPSVVIDNLVNRHSWAPVFVPVMYPGIAVSTGDRIRMTCSWSLSRNGINPDYRLEGVLILKDGTEIFFQYELPYFETAFLKNPFYRQLLIDNPAGFARNVFEYLDQRQLRKYLEAHLPSYMMPSHLIELEKIPLTPNGKVDKRALLAIRSGTDLTKDFMPPKSNTEKIIAQIWKEVLELDTVGVTDNFFEIGGTSLDIIRVTNRMKEALNRDIPVVHLFQYSNISTLAEYFDREESDDGFSGDDRVNAVERGKKDRFKRLQMKRGGNK